MSYKTTTKSSLRYSAVNSSSIRFLPAFRLKIPVNSSIVASTDNSSCSVTSIEFWI